MHRRLRQTVLVAMMASAGVLTSVAIAQKPSGTNQADARWVQAQARVDDAESRIQGDQAMDAAVAAAVIGAVSTEFGEREVQVTLDEVAVAPASIRDRTVSGEGRLRIGDDPEWIAFQFEVLYDTVDASAGVPALRLGSAEPASETVPLDSALATGLDARVNAELADEFSSQSVELVTTRVTASDAGSRYLRVEAIGTAEFAGEGTTPAQVRALYDRAADEWVRVHYELGTTSNWADEADPAVASR